MLNQQVGVRLQKIQYAFNAIQGWRQKLSGCRLCRNLAMALFLSVLAIEFVLFIPSYINYENNLKSERSQKALQAFQIIVSGHVADNPMYRRDVLRKGGLRGITLFEDTVPQALDGLLAGQENDLQEPGDQFFEVSWLPEATGLGEPINVRVDASELGESLLLFAFRIFGLTLVIALFVTFSTLFVFYKMVLSGLLALRYRIRLASQHTDKTLQYTDTSSVRPDELGDVERALNSLLELIATQMGSMKTLNSELDERVKTRTAQLADSNKKLKDEIKERQRYEQELIRKNWFDQLTGLPNRALFEERVNSQFFGSKKQQKKGVVMMLGLKNFGELNAQAGHQMGDKVLKMVASSLQAQFTEPCTIARLAGDVFAVHVPFDYEADAAEVDAEIQKIYLLEKTSIRAGDKQFQVTMSKGVTLYPEDGNDSESLLKNAELAMKRAKQQPETKLCFFSKDLEARLAFHRQLTADIDTAIEKKEFQLYFQPQLSREGDTVGFEALIRWHHKARGFISPADFIPCAEEAGQIVAIGDLVLEQAFQQLFRWHLIGKTWRLAVNLSTRQITDSTFLEKVSSLMILYPFDPTFLEFEITETALMKNIDEAHHVLLQLRDKGIQLAIDDFGTGYSSLSYLKTLPVDRIKIDKVFVDGIPDVEADMTLCITIINLAHNLGFTVIAEGVETDVQAQWLIEHQCDELQGFYFGRPVPIHSIEIHRQFNPQTNDKRV